MRTLIVSDIHANYPALRAVLKKVRRKGVRRIFCLGDIVGYGAEPNRVIRALDEGKRKKVLIRGNHDRVASGEGEPEDFNEVATEAIIWSRERLHQRSRKILNRLVIGPTVVDDALLCHGSPDDEDEYLLSEEQAARVFMNHEQRLIFFGHTHLPSWFELDGRTVEGFLAEPNSVLRLDPAKRYLINPGSVGQPRDRDNRSAFAVWDDEKETVRFSRIEYDFVEAGNAILAAGLPEVLARRLEIGF